MMTMVGGSSHRQWGRFFCLRNSQTEEPSPLSFSLYFMHPYDSGIAVDVSM